jgi:MCP family monocarboxylic acid transporter-like MFS transporter 14
VIPPIIEYLIAEYGWLNACFIFAAISSHMFISACLYRPISTSKIDQEAATLVTNDVQNIENEKNCFEQTMILLKILFTNKRYLVIILAYTILSFLITAPYNFLPDYISINSINDTHSISISFIGISTVFGQIFIGVISDKYVSYNWLIYSICLILAGFSTCILPLCKNLYLICIYSVFYGFLTSVNYVLQSNLVIEAVGIENLTFAFGCLQAFQGISTLAGTPAAAWLTDITGNYNITFFISGIFISISGFSLLLWPFTSRKKI